MTSSYFQSSKREIEEEWSLDDLYDSHDVIDMLDELEARRDPQRK